MEKVFSALADGNRRRIIELLSENNSTLLELSENFSISFQALGKHIKILEDAEIVRKVKKGKYRELSLNQNSFKQALEWISYYSNFWNESFDQLDSLVNRQNKYGDTAK
jgi:DNA-binding transcriptional ArsR family regulator